jgi:hypothetical protein
MTALPVPRRSATVLNPGTAPRQHVGFGDVIGECHVVPEAVAA